MGISSDTNRVVSSVKKPVYSAEGVVFKVLDEKTVALSISHVKTLKNQLKAIVQRVKEESEQVAFKRINNTIFSIQDFRNSLDAAHEKHLKTTFQKAILPLTNQSEFCRYCYQKPRGYAGDFVMMEMIWKGRTDPENYRYRGDSELGKLINALTLDMENCKANLERIFRLTKILNRTNYSSLASIGSGSVIEIFNYLNQTSRKKINIHLYDQDKGALELANKKLNYLGYYPINHSGNIMKEILKTKESEYELVYSSGLFDYFDLNSSKKLLQSLWKKAKSNGSLWLVNANPENKSKLWMEYCLEWEIKYKTIGEFSSLIDQIVNIKKIEIEKDNMNVYQYFHIKKE